MKKKFGLVVVLILLMTNVSVKAQKFKYTYNGTTITYRVISVPNHEVAVNYVPENVTSVTVPAVLNFNGENFKVTRIGSGGSRDGGWFGAYEGEGYYSFHNCRLLKTIILPNTVKEIGRDAFTGCSWLRSINLPSGLEEIEEDAFLGCESLTSIILPSSIKKLGRAIFFGCDNLASISVPKELGFIVGDSILVLNTEGYTVTVMNDCYVYGDKEIDKYAFSGSKYKIIPPEIFDSALVASPRYYLKESRGKASASLIKKRLINAGLYEDVLAFYPNDKELQGLKATADAKVLITQGDNLRDKHKYTEAKSKYEEAFKLIPNDKLLQMRITSIEEDISEAERQHKEAEEKARKEAEIAREKAQREREEKQVRKDVDMRAGIAAEHIKKGELQEAAITLEKAVDISKTHNYDYRQRELKSRIDSIKHIQEIIADPSIIHDYKIFARDLYNSTDQKIASNLRAIMLERDKRIERNNMTLTLFTDSNRKGTYTLGGPSRTLKNFCQEQLNKIRLQPIVIDGQQLNASATFNYSFEYAIGLVKVQHKKGTLSISPKYEMSSRLESDLQRKMGNELKTLPSSCNGNYKFSVASMDINGRMEHSVKLKSCSFDNGPQNAWRSLLVPFWGDKYVGGGITDALYGIGWTSTYVCYALVGYGTYSLVDNYRNGIYGISNNYYYISMIGIGGTAWIADVIYVWIKGAKNKKANKESLRRINFAYDVTHDAPELVYTLSF